jgi:hypothetical protein
MIAAQDFVSANGVRTVFGTGGSYLNGTVMVLVFFTREEIEKSQAIAFVPLANVFKAATLDPVMNDRIFA